MSCVSVHTDTAAVTTDIRGVTTYIAAEKTYIATVKTLGWCRDDCGSGREHKEVRQGINLKSEI